MEKITGTEVVNKVSLFCDGCEKQIGEAIENQEYLECSSVVSFDFGYSSSRDMERAKLLFCQHCAEKLLTVLKKEFPNIIKAEQKMKEEAESYFD